MSRRVELRGAPRARCNVCCDLAPDLSAVLTGRRRVEVCLSCLLAVSAAIRDYRTLAGRGGAT